MKKQLLDSLIILTLLTMQSGCKLFDKKTDTKAEYINGKHLEDMAYNMTMKRNTDSAIYYSEKALGIYKELVKTVDSTKDTLYVNRLLTVNGELGGLYFANEDFKMAISHFSEALKWAKLLHLGNMQEFETEMIGHSYLEWGNNQTDSTDMRKIIKQGIPYINEACNIIDSLGIDTLRVPDFTGIFYLAVNINATFGDTSKSDYFNSKYLLLLHKTGLKQ